MTSGSCQATKSGRVSERGRKAFDEQRVKREALSDRPAFEPDFEHSTERQRGSDPGLEEVTLCDEDEPAASLTDAKNSCIRKGTLLEVAGIRKCLYVSHTKSDLVPSGIR
ncbi:hypothetical protein CIRG_08318 [Coccidioides immitis RMSCC 2394]|uniref:Uncharacterized protein n=1 Tax=Coccidioides immitis RMSCC 2394 TaxID=404692 RepID=A0A0J7BER4_COCIT|nr:hypothetical protein CIRG_08318 [Coccidioides immitis RMSCC 2394]